MNDNATSALERLLRPLSSTLTTELAHALISVRADAETQARYDELVDFVAGLGYDPANVQRVPQSWD